MAPRPPTSFHLASLILLVVLTPSLVSGQCTFPANLTTGSWYSATVVSNDKFYWAVSYNGDIERLDAYNEVNPTTSLANIEHTCSNGGTVGDKYCFAATTKTGLLCTCLESVEYSIFAQQEMAFGTPTPQDCATSIETNSPDGFLNPFIKLSGTDFDYSATQDCPFTAGTYTTDVIHSGASQCSSSQMQSSVTGNSLVLDSCLSSSHTYATPSAATLTCVASFPGSVMDLDANGGILVLADMTNAMHPKFYCARYREESAKVYLSLAVTADYTVTTCPYNQTADSSDTTNGRYGFVLTSTSATTAAAVETTQPPVVTTAAAAPPTTQGPVDGPCAFPAGLTSSGWFRSYTQQSGYYWSDEYVGTKILTKAIGVADNMAVGDPLESDCKSGAEIGGKYCFFTQSSKDGDLCNCARISDYGYYFQSKSVVGDTLASACEADIGTNAASDPAPSLHPKAGFDYSGSAAWPFTAGTYVAEVYTSSGSTECAGDPTVSTLTGNTLMVRTCVAGASTYDTPSSTDLTHVGSWTLTDLGGASTTEGVAIVADVTNAAEPRFYCGFYEVSGTDVFLSLSIRESYDLVTCPRDANARSTGAGFYAFKFGLKDAAGTTAAAGPTADAGATTAAMDGGATTAAAPAGTTGAAPPAGPPTTADPEATADPGATAPAGPTTAGADAGATTAGAQDVTTAGPQANCVFPSDFEGTHWIGRNYPDQAGFFWVTGFQSPTLTEVVYKRSDSSLLAAETGDCVAGHNVGADYCFYYNHPKNGPLCTCARHATGCLLRKDKSEPTQLTPEQCSTSSASQDAVVLPQVTLDYSASSCSLATGEYSSTQIISSGTTTCSAATPTRVTANDITFCDYNSAGSPKTLTCVATFPGSAVDQDSNGDVLVLADLSNMDVPLFHCARMTKDAAGVVSMAYLVGAADGTEDAKCAHGGTSTSTGATYSTVVLTPENLDSTTAAAGATMDPGATAATPGDGATTAAPGGDLTTMDSATTTNQIVDYMLVRGCNYTQDLLDNNWWSSQVAGTLYFLVDFKEDGNVDLVLGPSGTTILDWSCQDMIGNETKRDGYLVSGGVDFCIRVYPGDPVSLVAIKELKLDTNVTADLDRCRAHLDAQTFYSGIVKHPFENRFENSTCPMPRGTYTVDYTDGFGTYCDGAGSVEVTVTTKDISIANCGTVSDSYDTPFKMNCIDMMPAWYLNADGGDILFMEWDGGQGFYCARYDLSEDGFSISYYHGEATSLECATFTSHQSNASTNVNTMQFDAKINYAFVSPWTDNVYYIGKIDVGTSRVALYNTYVNENGAPQVKTVTYLISPSGSRTPVAPLVTSPMKVENWESHNYYVYTATYGFICTKEILHDVITLRAEVKSTTVFSMAACKTTVDQNSLFRLYIQQSLADYTTTFALTEMAVPFGTAGTTYDMSFSYESNDICKGDAASTMQISGNTFVVTACSTIGAISTDFVTTTYTVYRTWSASVVGGDSADGDFILVGAGGGVVNLETSFYCGRYKTDSSGVIHLSLSINSTITTWCNRQQDATYSFKGTNADEFDKFVAFEFAPQGASVANAAVASAGVAPPPESTEPAEPSVSRAPFPADPQRMYPHMVNVDFSLAPEDPTDRQTVARQFASQLTGLSNITRHRIRSLSTTGSSLLEFVILPGQADEFSPLQAASYLHGQLNQDSDIFEEDVMQVSAEITEDWSMIEEYWGKVPEWIVVSFQLNAGDIEPRDYDQLVQQIAVHLGVTESRISVYDVTHLSHVSLTLRAGGPHSMSLLEMSARLRMHVTAGSLHVTDSGRSMVAAVPGTYSTQYDQDWACASHPCSNGARCLATGTEEYTCICSSGYSGANCEWQTELIMRCMLIILALTIPILIIVFMVVLFRRRQRRAGLTQRPSISNSSSLYEDIDDTRDFHPITPKSNYQTRWFPDFKKCDIKGVYNDGGEDC